MVYTDIGAFWAHFHYGRMPPPGLSQVRPEAAGETAILVLCFGRHDIGHSYEGEYKHHHEEPNSMTNNALLKDELYHTIILISTKEIPRRKQGKS